MSICFLANTMMRKCCLIRQSPDPLTFIDVKPSMVSSLVNSSSNLIGLPAIYWTDCKSNMVHNILCLAYTHIFMLSSLCGLMSFFLPHPSWTAQLLWSLNNWFNPFFQEVFLVSSRMPSSILLQAPLASYSYFYPYHIVYFMYWTKDRLSYLSDAWTPRKTKVVFFRSLNCIALQSKVLLIWLFSNFSPTLFLFHLIKND